MKRKILRLGIDFDGVTADPLEEKRQRLKKDYGRIISPEDCTRAGYASLGYPVEEYNDMLSKLYSSKDYLNMPEVPFAKQGWINLIKEGAELYIITLRTDKEAEIAKQYLAEHNFNYTKFINTTNEPKVELCQKHGLSALLDDSLSHLGQARNQDIRLYLFDRPYNAQLKLPEGIVRVKGWKDFVKKIKAL